jgi:hypothetical protein
MRLKKVSLNGCTGQIILRGNQGSILTATVVAELELNSINPPPDTVEEEKNKLKDSFKPIT